MGALRKIGPVALGILGIAYGACGSTEEPSSPEARPLDPPPGTTAPVPETPPKPDPLPVPPGGKHMGATPVEGGVEFRVWAPNAKAVRVVGDITSPLSAEEGGTFYARVAGAKAGQRYRYAITTADGTVLERIDPRARAVEGKDAIVVDPRTYAWVSKPFTPTPRDKAIIYEMHVGSFHAPNGIGTGTFATAAAKLDALADLGVNTIELMPIDMHGTKHGWGYNPQAWFAPHPQYGSPDELRAFVDAAHTRGISVILDVVYNHYDGWKEAPLRCFDGTCPDNTAGVYFFEKGPYEKTPWGPRPAFAKKEVADFFADAVFAWMSEYRIDGFRQDSVSNVRAIDGKGTVPGGSELLQRLNEVAEKVQPSALLVAEDLKGHAPITATTASGGLGFDTQWDGFFHFAVTSAAIATTDDARNIATVRDALVGSYNGDPFQRLIYIESHDTAGNEGARLPVRIDPADPKSVAARRRTMLAAGLLLTAPGVPMLFMGQEMLEAEKFVPQPAPLDWTRATTFSGVLTFHRDLVRLRRNEAGTSAGLLGKNVSVTHLNDTSPNKVIAYRRWGTDGDDVMVIANFGQKSYTRYDIGLPQGGTWVARVDSDHVRYGDDLGKKEPTAVTVMAQPRDGLPFTGAVALGPYSMVVLTH